MTLTPKAPLAGFTLYKLVATTGVKDRVGRTLPSTYVSTFTTIDNVPPAVTSIVPVSSATQVPLDGVVRLTFSEAVDPTALDGITLLQGGGPVAARLDLIQEGRVAILTPLAPLAPNLIYTVSVAGVRDLPGNVMTGAFTAGFATLDTIVPTVTGLDLAAGSHLISGNSVSVTATVADADVALVDFSSDDALVATARSAPFKVTVPLDHTGEVVLKAVAQDRVGNRGPARQLVLTVAADQPPTASILAPEDGSVVDSGQTVTVTVAAQDDLQVKEVTLSASGAASFTQTLAQSGSSATAAFNLPVPAAAAPGSTITLTAVAKDGAGQASSSVQRTLLVRDGTPPAVTLSSPGQTGLYRPGEAGSVTVTASDYVGVGELTCSVAGSAVGEGSWSFAPTVKQIDKELAFTVNADAAPHALVTIACTAKDAAGNVGNADLTLQVADTVPPQVVGTSMAGKTWGVATDSPLTVSFDEPLDPATVGAQTVQLANDADGTAIPGQVTLSADHKSIVFNSTALSDDTKYRLTVAGTVADLSGNQLGSDYVASFATLPANTAVIQDQGTASAPYVLAGGSYRMVSIDHSYVVFAGPIGAESVTLTNGSVATQAQTGDPEAGRVEIAAGEIVIDATSKIDVSGRGYAGGSGTSTANETGRTLGNTTTGGSGRSSGGSYGGLGGVYSGSVNAAYGDPTDPNEYGSGGGGYYYDSYNRYAGGAGGGLVRLTAGTLQLDGTIAADGQIGQYSRGGGGSGGGVRLDVGTLAGSGKIYARGGQGYPSSAAGGGGRIAVYYDNLALPAENISARGGYYNNTSANADRNGGAGTVYLQSGAADYGDLVLDNGGVYTSRPSRVADLTLGSLTVRGKTDLLFGGAVTVAAATALNDLTGLEFGGTLAVSGDLVVVGLNGSLKVDSGAVLPADLTLSGGTVTLASALSLGGTLHLQDNATLTASKIEVQAATVMVDAGSKIDVSGGGTPAGAGRAPRTRPGGRWGTRRPAAAGGAAGAATAAWAGCTAAASMRRTATRPTRTSTAAGAGGITIIPITDMPGARAAAWCG